MDGAMLGLLESSGVSRDGLFKHVTLDRHGYLIALWLINDTVYEALPRDLQQVVEAGFHELKRLTFTFPHPGESDALATFAAGGGSVYTPTTDERRAFIMAAGRVSTWFMDTYGADWIVWLEEAIAEVERRVRRPR
jgi:TRAP-type C4-dicarboxylate transport system substrate-binding protein